MYGLEEQGVKDFIQWLADTHRVVSYAGSMAVEFHPSDPKEAKALFDEYAKVRS